VYGRNVTEAITATTLGIGLPEFQWRVNGKLLLGRNTTLRDTVMAQVDVPDPQHPDHPFPQTQTLTFDYEIQGTAAGGSSTLKLISSSLDGAYHVDVQVNADETAVPTGAVTAKQGLTLTTRTVRYRGTYDDDQKRCENVFMHATARLVRVHENLDLLRTLPDPPPPDYLTKVLEAAVHIQEELTHLAATDHATASQIAHYAAGQLGVPARVFLKGARADE
jgi:hypothetical protein